MIEGMTLSEYVKSKGVRSVRILAEFEGVQPHTMNRRWNSGNMTLIDIAIRRYKKKMGITDD